MAKEKAPRKNAAAAALGRRRMELLSPEERIELASKAGKRRLKKIPAAKRKEIAQKAAAARWAKKKGGQSGDAGKEK